jgi:hypothetical protein
VGARGRARSAAAGWPSTRSGMRQSPARYCISVATSSSPLGPFVDRHGRPFVATPTLRAPSTRSRSSTRPPARRGCIWKSEGVVGSMPTRLWAAAAGQAPARLGVRQHAPRAPPHRRCPGRGTSSRTRRWCGTAARTGCSTRPTSGVLAATAPRTPSAPRRWGRAAARRPRPSCRTRARSSSRAGGSAIVDASGRLRLAYHWWNAPYTNYPTYSTCAPAGTCTTQGQRRMSVTVMRLTSTGHLALG